MKVFVATSRGQGVRSNDFCFTVEGEFVLFPSECDREAVDGSCGCRRSMSGMHTKKGTTTFMVADKGITEEQFVELWRKSMVTSGWIEDRPLTGEEKQEPMELLRIAGRFLVGTVLERRGNKIQVRALSKKTKAN